MQVNIQNEDIFEPPMKSVKEASHPNFAQLCPPEDDDEDSDCYEANNEIILEEL